PPADHGPLSKNELLFLDGFDKASKLPKDAGQLAEQQRLTDLVRGLLSNFKEVQTMEKSDAASRELLAALTDMPADLRASLQSMPGTPDLRNLTTRQSKEPVLQLTVEAHDLGLYKGSEDDWVGLERQVAADFYTEGYEKAVSAQSQLLTDQTAAYAKAPSDAGLRSIGQTLNGIVNPQFITSGFVAALPRLTQEAPGKRLSSRDQQLLDAWKAIRARMLETSAKIKAQYPDAADKIQRAAQDPADAEAVTEALRLAGFPVYDERLLRVATNPAAAGQDATGRDGEALRQMLGQYKLKSGDPALAADLTAALLKDLGGDKSKGQEAYRLDQLLRSTSDETRAQFDKLQQSVDELRGSADYAKQRQALASGSLRQLEALAGKLQANADAQDEATAVARADSDTAEGRARSLLASRFFALKAQSQLSISFHSSDAAINEGMEGFSVSGWLLGRPDVDKVVRRVHHETGGGLDGSPQRGAVSNSITGETIAGPPRDPKGGRDGLDYVLAGGEGQDFASLDGRRLERTRSTIVDNPTGSGRPVQMFVDGKGVTVYREVGANGRAGAAFEMDPLGRRARPDAAGGSLRAVQTVSILTRSPNGEFRSAGTLTQYQARKGDLVFDATAKRDQTVLLKFLKPGGSAGSYTEVDYQRHTLFERRGGGAVEYSLDPGCSALAASRGRTVFKTAGGRLTAAYSESIGPDHLLTRRVLDADPSVTPSFTMSLGIGDKATGSLAGVRQAEIDRRLRDDVETKLTGKPSGASVRIDAGKFKTPQARAGELMRVEGVLTGLGLLDGGRGPQDAAFKLMSFYDGSRGRSGRGGGEVADVSFRFGPGGSLGVDQTSYDRRTRKTSDESHDYEYHRDLPAAVVPEPLGRDDQPAHVRAVQQAQAQNVLAMIRLHSGLTSAFVETDGGRPTAFFSTGGTYAVGRHTVGVGGKEGEGKGSWVWAADVTRSFSIDGQEVDRFKVGE
ncbi:MAG TPA: hypothetical protein VH309_02035, partial [Elusimicrobiota bacterium]|nr:hypothetical protein [Elusimicrobiota bacterium]